MSDQFMLFRRSAMLIILAFFISMLPAQVSVEFSAVNEYMFNTRQALNLVIVNSNPKSFPVHIKGRISDAGGQPVVEFRSSDIMLNAGSNLVNPMSATLEELNYSNQDIAEIENRTGTYPSGNYTICVWLQCVTQDCSGAGSGAAGMEQVKCMPVHIENPTPLILATPGNESEIEETRPLFTWIPPSPVAGSSNLNYTMVLVEMMEGQNKADALNMNRPLIQMEGIGQPSLMFPPDLPALEPGKSYAWQVEAFVGKTSIAKSEQWKFRIKKKEEKKETVRYYDAAMHTGLIKIKNGEKLYFALQGVMNREPQFSLLKKGKSLNAQIQKITKDSLNPDFDEFSQDLVQNGLTKFFLETASLNCFSGDVYELRIQLANHKKYVLRFEITD